MEFALSDERTVTPSPASVEEPEGGIKDVVRQFPMRMLAIAATGFVGGVAEAGFLVIIVRAVTAVTEGREDIEFLSDLSVGLSVAVIAALGALLLRLVMALLNSYQSARLAYEAVALVRRRLMGSFFEAEWSVQQDQRVGSVQEFVSSYTTSVSGYLSSLSSLILATANLTALLGAAVFLSPAAALILMAVLFGLALMLRPIRSAIGRRSRRASKARARFVSYASEYTSLAMEMRIFNSTPAAQERLEKMIETSRRHSTRSMYLTRLTSPTYSTVAYAGLLLMVVAISTFEVGDVGTVGAVMLLVLRSLGYGQALQSALAGLSSSRPVADDLFDEIARLEAARQPVGLARPTSVESIEARAVTFEYEPGKPALNDVNFTIKRKEIVGIVGPSGSGKSTLVHLLLGLHAPTSGSVLCDGVDVREIDTATRARLATFVPQKPGFLSGTIGDNVRFLRDGVSDEDLEAATRRAYIYDEVVAMPGGFERDIGERGGHLSGGQQQRIAIARALIESPDLMILDEPTSALDVRSEHLLRTTLLELREQMAIVVIAHRLSTLDICDRIMVIQDGEIVAFDTPKRLAESSDFYREALELSGIESAT